MSTVRNKTNVTAQPKIDAQPYIHALRKNDFIGFLKLKEALGDYTQEKLREVIAKSDFDKNDLEHLIKIRAYLFKNKKLGKNNRTFLNNFIARAMERLASGIPSAGWNNESYETFSNHDNFKEEKLGPDQGTYNELETEIKKAIQQNTFDPKTILNEANLEAYKNQKKINGERTQILEKNVIQSNSTIPTSQPHSNAILIATVTGLLIFGVIAISGVVIGLTGGFTAPAVIPAAAAITALIVSSGAAMSITAAFATAVAVVTAAVTVAAASIGGLIGNWIARKFASKPSTKKIIEDFVIVESSKNKSSITAPQKPEPEKPAAAQNNKPSTTADANLSSSHATMYGIKSSAGESIKHEIKNVIHIVRKCL